jgi:hypothetical protein
MIALLILVTSLIALAEFAIFQWRSVWHTVAQQPVSESLHTATGISPDRISAEDFELLAQTSERLCPSPEEGNVWLREVRLYYRTLRALGKVGSAKFDESSWIQSELAACSRYAAVVLDQRLSANYAFASDVAKL